MDELKDIRIVDYGFSFGVVIVLKDGREIKVRTLNILHDWDGQMYSILCMVNEDKKDANALLTEADGMKVVKAIEQAAEKSIERAREITGR